MLFSSYVQTRIWKGEVTKPVILFIHYIFFVILMLMSWFHSHTGVPRIPKFRRGASRNFSRGRLRQESQWDPGVEDPPRIL